MKNNVVYLDAFRPKVRESKQSDYAELVSGMDRLELLAEMVRFQEERAMVGYLSPELVQKGIPLFKILLSTAETNELRILLGVYLKHLEQSRFKTITDSEGR